MPRLIFLVLVSVACSGGQRAATQTAADPTADANRARSDAGLRQASAGPVSCTPKGPCPCRTQRKTKRVTYVYPKTRHGEIVWCERKDGTKHGPWREMWPSGKPKKAGQYAEGKRVGEWVEHHEEGLLYKKYTLLQGVRHGSSTIWHPNGKISERQSFRHGKPSGVWRAYHANGTLESQAQWVNGKLHGPDIRYDKAGYKRDVHVYDNGTLTRLDRYKNGKLVKSRPPRDRADPKCEPDFDEICDDDTGGRP